MYSFSDMYKSRIIAGLLILAITVVSSACKEEYEDTEYIARVGDRMLTKEDLGPQFQVFAFGQDSSEALEQIVEDWVRNELIAQEAIRRGLRNDEELQRQLEENERSILVSTFVSRLYDDEDDTPTEEEMQAYYAQNAEQLALREDYIRVRYIKLDTQQEAEEFIVKLRDATVAGNVESAWPNLVNQHSNDKDASLLLASQYYPESMLFTSIQLRNIVSQLDINQISPVINEGNAFHVVQLVERREAGQIPELNWIEEELKQRLSIETRKQLLARQVQRLRTEALAREDLEIRYLND